MVELLKAILFGIVEGITEWLPVSSTGHMIILDELIKLDCTPEFLEMFTDICSQSSRWIRSCSG